MACENTTYCIHIKLPLRENVFYFYLIHNRNNNLNFPPSNRTSEVFYVFVWDLILEDIYDFHKTIIPHPCCYHS